MNPRPWLSAYTVGLPTDLIPDHDSMLAAFEATLNRCPDAPAVCHFREVLTFRDLDDWSDALAAALQEGGFSPGDRVALFTQNDPEFVVGVLAAWKAGGIAVLINPMNKERELTNLLQDSGAAALLSLDELWESTARHVVGTDETEVRQVFLYSARQRMTQRDERHTTTAVAHESESQIRLLTDVLARFAHVKPALTLKADGSTPAAITYTSGTTGQPKGAINTHGALVFNSQTFRTWMQLDEDDVILGIAPLFHITGLVGHVCTSLLIGSRLVLAHRFDTRLVLEAIREHRPTFTVGAITAFNALAHDAGASREDFASLRVVYSGGAPIAPALRDAILERTGMNIHNCYGMTETNAPTHGVPLGASAPVDPTSGALSIGVPVFNTLARIIGDDGSTLPPLEIGEIAITGPQVIPGYWNKPNETAERIVNGEIRTGDVGLMDNEGWFYLVDRKSDMIIASGYKVWPREVEDVLLSHPAVREAAVIGVTHDYRGETVKAFVSLVAAGAASPDELIDYCRAQMAAYKYPREVELVEELPRNAAGKILRSALRSRGVASSVPAGANVDWSPEPP